MGSKKPTPAPKPKAVRTATSAPPPKRGKPSWRNRDPELWLLVQDRDKATQRLQNYTNHLVGCCGGTLVVQDPSNGLNVRLTLEAGLFRLVVDQVLAKLRGNVTECQSKIDQLGKERNKAAQQEKEKADTWAELHKAWGKCKDLDRYDKAAWQSVMEQIELLDAQDDDPAQGADVDKDADITADWLDGVMDGRFAGYVDGTDTWCKGLYWQKRLTTPSGDRLLLVHRGDYKDGWRAEFVVEDDEWEGATVTHLGNWRTRGEVLRAIDPLGR